MVRTWIANIEALKDPDYYRQCYEAAPAVRKQKADRIRTMEGKCQSIGVWRLYEEICRAYDHLGSAPYNFSHSGEYVLCSIADGEGTRVGCDIERMREAKLRIAKRRFCKQEYAKLLQCEGKARDELFYRYWVLKESFAKATGKGLSIGLDTFRIGFREGREAYLAQRPEDVKEEYYYREYEVPKLPYKIAVCSTDKEFGDTLQREIRL